METAKADIVQRLRKEILQLQGIPSALPASVESFGLGPINAAFPGKTFPLAAVHEFIMQQPEAAAASSAFVMALVGKILPKGASAVWISAQRKIFPPALKSYGISPEQFIFIGLKKDKEIQWAMEEALKCKGLGIVLAEMQELDFTSSRRLQLAVEKSRVTGFVFRNNPRSINTNACFTRWQISALPALLPPGLPGVGYPRWKIELLKVRNGIPGSWELSFVNGQFRHAIKTPVMPLHAKQKTG